MFSQRYSLCAAAVASGLFLVAVVISTSTALGQSKNPAGNGGEVDTEHLFGFTQGSDIGEAGEREVEADSTGRFGRRDGSYAVSSTSLEAKYTPLEYFRIAAGATVATYNIASVSGIDDRRELAFQALSLELRYRLLDREHAPFGLTFGIVPHWGFVDEASGAPANQYGAQFSIATDKEFIAKQIYGAFNLLYEPEQTRLHGASQTQRQSTLGFGAAIAAQVRPGIFWGAELRYLRQYEGLALNNFVGQALYAGPTLYARLSEKWWLSAAWNIQVTGSTVGLPGALDLVNFERHQAKLRLGFTF
jgi:hypothetical protein